MARVLILSSYVAASRVGGGAQALALARLGIEPILIPTVLFGRHPGHGPPGGGAVDAETFAGMIGGVEAQGLFGRLDAVITGHFSMPEQVAIAADALKRVKAASPGVRLIVDPIMGDDGKGLYVKDAVAAALTELLVPGAGIVAPNAWELGRLAGLPVSGAASAIAAARALGKPVVVSSIRSDGRIGAAYVDRDEAWLAVHAAAIAAPNGTGDLLTALFTAAILGHYPPPAALELAVSGVAEAVATADGQDELPLIALPTVLAPSSRVQLTPIHG
jgi:pyridoxine kinase